MIKQKLINKYKILIFLIIIFFYLFFFPSSVKAGSKQQICSCSSGGCTCTTTFSNFIASGCTLTSATLTVKVIQSDFNSSSEYVEWIKADGDEIQTHCNPGKQGYCSSYYTCLNNSSVTPYAADNNLQVSIKISSAVNCCCSPYLKAQVTLNWNEVCDSSPSAPTSLQTEGETNPMNLTTSTPSFDAIYQDTPDDDVAVKYRIQVDDNSDFSSPVWDSGASGTTMTNCNQGSRCSSITYAGPELTRGVMYYWRIKFWDDVGQEGAWSTEEAKFKLKSGCPESSSTIDYDCSWENNLGTDSETGNIIVGIHEFSGGKNNSTMTVAAGKTVTILANQTVVVGSIDTSQQGSIVIMEGGRIVLGGTLWYHDNDQDAHAPDNNVVVAPHNPGNLTHTNDIVDYSDCNDNDGSKWQYLTGYPDADNDGYTSGGAQQVCAGDSLPSGWSATQNGNDCNDSDGSKWQYLTGYPDADGDGYGGGNSQQICSGTTLPFGYASTGNDCDDNDSSRWQYLTGYPDNDGDGYGTGSGQQICTGDSLPSGYASSGSDCNDSDNSRWRERYKDADGDHYCASSTKYCVGNHSGYRDSCSSYSDCNDSDSDKWQYLSCHRDYDHDGYGRSSTYSVCSGSSCPYGYSSNGTDCDDYDSSRWRERYKDADGDHYCASSTKYCVGNHSGYRDSCSSYSDCNDSDSDKWRYLSCYTDNDGDTYGVGSSQSVCSGYHCPSGYASRAGDCCDSDSGSRPGASWHKTANACGSWDWNCNGSIEKDEHCDNCVDGCVLCGLYSDYCYHERTICHAVPSSGKSVNCGEYCYRCLIGKRTSSCGVTYNLFGYYCDSSEYGLYTCGKVTYASCYCK